MRSMQLQGFLSEPSQPENRHREEVRRLSPYSARSNQEMASACGVELELLENQVFVPGAYDLPIETGNLV